MEPTMWLDLRNLKSWPEPKQRVRCLTNWAIGAPLSSIFLLAYDYALISFYLIKTILPWLHLSFHILHLFSELVSFKSLLSLTPLIFLNPLQSGFHPYRFTKTHLSRPPMTSICLISMVTSRSSFYLTHQQHQISWSRYPPGSTFFTWLLGYDTGHCPPTSLVVPSVSFVFLYPQQSKAPQLSIWASPLFSAPYIHTIYAVMNSKYLSLNHSNKHEKYNMLKTERLKSSHKFYSSQSLPHSQNSDYTLIFAKGNNL